MSFICFLGIGYVVISDGFSLITQTPANFLKPSIHSIIHHNQLSVFQRKISVGSLKLHYETCSVWILSIWFDQGQKRHIINLWANSCSPTQAFIGVSPQQHILWNESSSLRQVKVNKGCKIDEYWFVVEAEERTRIPSTSFI